MVSNSSARQFLCSFYFKKFIFSSTFRSTMVCHVLGNIICFRSYARGNAMVGGIQRVATCVHLWQQGCCDTAQHISTLSFPAKEGMVIQKGPAPVSANHQRYRSVAEVGKHEARGKHQRGKQDLTQRGEQIYLMLFFSCSVLPQTRTSFLLSSRPFFLALASQEQECSSVLSPMPSNLLNKYFS